MATSDTTIPVYLAVIVSNNRGVDPTAYIEFLASWIFSQRNPSLRHVQWSAMDPNNTPALNAPPGEVSNLTDSYSAHYVEIIVSAVSLFLSALAVAIRNYTRAAILKQFDLTDCALIIGLVSGHADLVQSNRTDADKASMAALFGVGVDTGRFGQGKHQWNVSIADFLQLQVLTNIIEILYNPVTFSVKYVIIRQIESIFFGHRHNHIATKFLWALIWANLVFYTILLFLFIFACVPRAKLSNPELPGRCINTLSTFIAAGAINLVSDLTILYLPISSLSKLQMAPKAKLGAIVVFGVGIFAIVAGTIRLYYSVKITQTSDITYAIDPVAIWAFIEFTAIFFVACFPSFPRFYRHMTKRDASQSSQRSRETPPWRSYKLKTFSRPSRRHESGASSSVTELRPQQVTASNSVDQVSITVPQDDRG
ncbi:hypothetical protein F4861DRAFT_536107 [Xylaria intraflava]|nr:hypothetical protein F4861DRAFT_536107 [Xylaria intraflava]